MKKNKWSLSLLCSVLALCFLASEPSIAQNTNLKQEKLIVGEWFPLNTSKEGIGTGYTFNEDGKYSTAMGAYVVFNFKLEKDTLISIFPGEKELKQKVEIKSNKMIFSNNVKDVEFTRIAGDSTAGIIGKWTGDADSGLKQIIDFTTSQKEYHSIPMRTMKGTYEIKGDIVALLGEANASYQWSVIDNVLTLKSTTDEKIYSYIRIQ